ncbi:N-acetyl-gamma-glutamyl-phosphate reductase [Phytoactinopolyspora mesophila]|uniref:N-acetyl-gamma-glutamyl-phosphate reductase n=1 Tax=Phytoactinopolyspora mesophila TaxID=2650750 RepID=A0A7K3M290_9ACTN|nr:N-acetyl-gamma-glutamyl-phosphate reductase [Phytoactinopolyspora mesophila]
MNMVTTVAVAGASGYAGGELLRLLSNHPEFEVGAVTAHSSAGDKLGRHHPNLIGLAGRTLQPTTPDVLDGHDAVALALPHGASAEIAAAMSENTLVVDCGADHRLTDPDAWKQFYGTEHAGSWPYGLPELVHADGSKQRERLANARRIAVPGCNVTAVTLAMAPGLAAGVIAPTDIVAVLANGPSGAGKSLKTQLLASEILGAASPYAVGGGHRHIPEIEQNLALAAGAPISLSFTPTLVPMSRGILATVTAKLNNGVTSSDARSAWGKAYADEPFVHLLPEGQWPTTAATVGANTAHIQVTVDERAGRLVAVAAIDNLTKGTAGAAVQCMNLALGRPETLGLPTTGVAP